MSFHRVELESRPIPNNAAAHAGRGACLFDFKIWSFPVFVDI